MAQTQRSRVVTLYKTLVHMGKDYPQGYEWFRGRCHTAFMKNRDAPPEKVEELLRHGDYIVKELEALYALRKYRTLKRRYYRENEELHMQAKEIMARLEGKTDQQEKSGENKA